MKNKPNYNLIYNDIINKKYPEKRQVCHSLLMKADLTAMDIIKLNRLIFGQNKEADDFSKKLRSYDRSDIARILNHQKVNSLNNTQTARHFKLSRNTLAKWRKRYF